MSLEADQGGRYWVIIESDGKEQSRCHPGNREAGQRVWRLGSFVKWMEHK